MPCEIDKEKYFERRRKGDSQKGRYSPVDFRTEEQSKESKEKRMLDWGKLKLEDAVKVARKIRGAEDSDDFDTSNKRLHTLFTKEKGKEDKNRFFAFVDVNRKAEVVVRGFSYKKGDKGYNEIEKAADSILKNLEKEVTFEGQEMTILEVINRISRNTFKYKAGRVDSEKKSAAREQFGKLVEEAIKNVKMLFPFAQIIFANGGDRTNDNIPESSIEGIEFVFGVGGEDKKNSSSWILKKYKKNSVN